MKDLFSVGIGTDGRRSVSFLSREKDKLEDRFGLRAWDTQGSSSKTVAGLKGPLAESLIGNKGNRFAGPTEALLSPENRGQALSAFTLDPSAFAQVGKQLQSTSQGDYLDVAHTPAGQALIAAITGNQQAQLAQQAAGLRSQFAQSGQNLSGPLMQATQQAGSTASAQTARDIMAQLFPAYESERGRQLAATGALGQYEQFPLQSFLDVARLFTTQKTETPAPSAAQQAMGWLGAIIPG